MKGITTEQHETAININVGRLREAINKSGYSETELGIACGKSRSYLNQCWRTARMGSNFINRLCLIIKRSPEEFFVEIEPEAAHVVDGTQTAELKAEITAINDAMASMVRMLETVQNTVKRISDEVSTLKDVEYTAAQESKRFYQAGNAMFKSIQYWLKGNNKEV